MLQFFVRVWRRIYGYFCLVPQQPALLYCMKHIVLIVCIFFAAVGVGQPPDVFFSKFGGSEKEVGYSAIEIPYRKYAVIGTTTSFGVGGTDAYLILVDSMGKSQWQKTFGGPSTDVGKSIVYVDSDSGFVFVGYRSPQAGGYDVWAVRVDKDGNKIWEESYDFGEWEFGNECIRDGDGDIIICGSIDIGPYGEVDGLLMKVKMEDGSIIWSKMYGGSKEDELTRVSLDKNGHIIAGGNSSSYGDINSDFWFLKIDGSTGDSLMTTVMGNSNKAEWMYDFIIDNQDNFVLAGSYDTSALNVGKNVSYLYKVDSNFGFISDTIYDGKGNDEKFRAICTSKVVDYYILARSIYQTNGATDLQVMKLLYDYQFVDAKDHGDLKDDEGLHIISTSDNGVAISGYRSDDFTGQPDLYLLKLDLALTYAPIVSAVPSMESKSGSCYIYENRIFIRNPSLKSLKYTIFDVYGRSIAEGQAIDSVIILNPNLKTGIYVIIIDSEIPQRLKFQIN